jgi:hypothetical protein
MTQPHMGRSRPLQILLTTNRLSRGISGFAKVHTGAAGGRGGRARRALPSPPPVRPRPGRSRGPRPQRLGSRRGGSESALPHRPSSSAPSTWGPGRPATWGNASPGGPRRGSPGWPRPCRAPPHPRSRPAPFPAPSFQLPPGPPRWPRLSSRARGIRRGPATGGTCAPQIQETVPERRLWLWARGETALCAGTCSGVFPTRSKTFYTFFKMLFPVAWISLGLFLKPCLGSDPRASRGGGTLRPGGPEDRVLSLRKVLSRPRTRDVLTSSGWSLGTKQQSGFSSRPQPDNTWPGFQARDQRHPSAVSGREPAAAGWGGSFPGAPGPPNSCLTSPG